MPRQLTAWRVCAEPSYAASVDYRFLLPLAGSGGKSAGSGAGRSREWYAHAGVSAVLLGELPAPLRRSALPRRDA